MLMLWVLAEMEEVNSRGVFWPIQWLLTQRLAYWMDLRWDCSNDTYSALDV